MSSDNYKHSLDLGHPLKRVGLLIKLAEDVGCVFSIGSLLAGAER